MDPEEAARILTPRADEWLGVTIGSGWRHRRNQKISAAVYVTDLQMRADLGPQVIYTDSQGKTNNKIGLRAFVETYRPL